MAQRPIIREITIAKPTEGEMLAKIVVLVARKLGNQPTCLRFAFKFNSGDLCKARTISNYLRESGKIDSSIQSKIVIMDKYIDGYSNCQVSNNDIIITFMGNFEMRLCYAMYFNDLSKDEFARFLMNLAANDVDMTVAESDISPPPIVYTVQGYIEQDQNRIDRILAYYQAGNSLMGLATSNFLSVNDQGYDDQGYDGDMSNNVTGSATHCDSSKVTINVNVNGKKKKDKKKDKKRRKVAKQSKKKNKEKEKEKEKEEQQ